MIYQDLSCNVEEIDKKIIELKIQNESLDRETAAFLEELKITPQQLSTFISNKANFDEKGWSTLQKERNQLEEKLQSQIDNIRNPRNAQKAYSERKVAPHWLFVR